MVEQISKDLFLQAFLVLMAETFERGRAGYLDRGASLFETLATISAEEASRPVSADCATIAAHVAHMTLALDFSLHLFRGERLQVDWGEIWRTVREVTDEEWTASQEHLRETYIAFRELAKITPWQNVDEIEGAMEVLAHNAYHLGEIRHALCTIKPER
ncbi:MAG: hypothetical protein K8J31_27320 [Anaerolineae bacterium]|nr:hypothetical protein [Anaerolineae bacterium]